MRYWVNTKKSWGFPFRRGFFEINETDFTTTLASDEDSRRFRKRSTGLRPVML